MRIGLILKTLDEEYQFSIYRGARKRAEELGCDLVCIYGEDFDDAGGIGTSFFPAGKILPLDGIILLSAIFSDNLLPDAPLFSGPTGAVPAVTIGSAAPGCLPILVDSREALNGLMDHLLIVHGYRRFLYIGGPVRNEDNRMRQSVFTERIGKASRDDPSIFLKIRNGSVFSEGEGSRIIQEYIREHNERDVDVILSGSDDTAIGIQKYLNSLSHGDWKHCPVTGFDDIPAAALEDYALTTVHQPLGILGETGVSALVNLIENRAQEAMTVQASFVVRSSCGCDRDRAADHGDANIPENLLQPARDFGYFGQAVMNIPSIDELYIPLSSFVRNIDVPQFFLFTFPPTAHEIPETAALIYSRTPHSGEEWYEGGKPVNIRHFLKEDIFAREEMGPHFLFSLRSGHERFGYMLYSADADVLPFLSFCGVFIANTLKRLHIIEQEKRNAELLEKRVEERTTQLKREAGRREALEADFLKLSDLERMRFGMDLHDDICQRLAGIAMICKNYSDIHPVMQTLSKMSSQALEQTREYAYSSFPIDIGSIGLCEALRNLCRDTNREHPEISCRFSGPETNLTALDEDTEVNLFRIAREALHNAVKHSGASSIEISAEPADGDLILIIADNGTGNPELISEHLPIINQRRPRGLGLRSMAYRAHQLGAKYSFTSNMDSGTSVTVRVPLRSSKT